MTRVAAIDCGTNSIRLLVADVVPGRPLADVHREMRVVRLGQGVDATGRIAPAALARTRAALADYAALARQAGAERVRMVATSATRDAANTDEFFAMTAEVLGVPAEVITGDGEARLSFAGAVADLDPARGPFLLTDVGGGSTEVVLGDWDGVEARVRSACSVDIGCVRLTERCMPDTPPSARQVAEATALAERMLADGCRAVDVAAARTWLGVAGTVTTISALHQGLAEYDASRTHHSELPATGIARVTDWLLAATRDELAAQPVIDPGRRDVLAAGAVVVRALGTVFGAASGPADLLVSEHDILDGIALSVG